MARRLSFSSPLERALTRIQEKEASLWGRLQIRGHESLLRLESSFFVRRYRGLLKSQAFLSPRSQPAIDLDSLLLPSFLLHLLLFFLLTRLTLTPPLNATSEPVLVRLVEAGQPGQETTERAPKKPRKTRPLRADARASIPVAEQKPAAPARPTTLAAPKALALAPAQGEIAPSSDPVESLIRLPRRQPDVGQGALPAKADPLPGALTGEGASLPQSLRRAEGALGTGAGSSSGVSASSRPDFEAYLRAIKRRVESVWRFPEGISGKHLVGLSFILDRAGNLVRVEVIGSTDSRLDSSAVDAMKRASPFPPIPENLVKELAGWPLLINLSKDLSVKVTR